MLHCHFCGTCSEYNDHHCGVIQVCVCGANYKYFVLFIYYGGAQLLLFALGVASLQFAIKNDIIKKKLNESSIVIVMASGITSIMCCSMTCIFLADPWCTDKHEGKIYKRLEIDYPEKEYPDFVPRDKWMYHHCGSRFNVCWWLLPF